MVGMTQQEFLNGSKQGADTGEIEDFNPAQEARTATQFIGQRAETGLTL